MLIETSKQRLKFCMLNILQVLPMWLTSSPSPDFMLAINCVISRGTLLAQYMQVHPNLFVGGRKPTGASEADISGLPSSHSLMGSLGTSCHILSINYSPCFSSPWVVELLARSLLCDSHQEGWPPWRNHIIWAETFAALCHIPLLFFVSPNCCIKSKMRLSGSGHKLPSNCKVTILT